MNFTKADLEKDTLYHASRSGGKGGQNVNKVSSRVELLFNLNQSPAFTDEQKVLIFNKLASRLNKDGWIQVICDEERSQYLNKELAMERLVRLLHAALIVPKKRKATKPGKAAIAKRLDSKKYQAEKKQNRRFNSGE